MPAVKRLDRDHFLIKSLIDSYRQEWQRTSGQRYKEKRKYFYISDVSKCDREIYYCFHNAEKKRTIADKTLILFRNGNMQHEEVQFRLKSQKVIDNSRDLEFGLEDWEVEATGRLDVFANDNKGLTVTEIKAKNPYSFASEEPEPYEVDQLLWYIFAAKKSKSIRQRKVNSHGFIIYVEGWPISDFPFAGWQVEYDEGRVQAIRDRFKGLKKVISDKKLPQRPHERDSIKCQYCVFREFCWQGVPEIIEPERLPDVSIEKPEMELVESAQDRYIELDREIKEREAKKKELKELLVCYFKATGTKETEKITHFFSKSTYLDRDYLLKELSDKWHLIANPNISLMRKAVEDGEVDGEILERAKKVAFSDSLRIKGGVNANKESK